MSQRFQFSLRALLVAMLVVAAFFGGMAVQRRLDKPKHVAFQAYSGLYTETVETHDGERWVRIVRPEE